MNEIQRAKIILKILNKTYPSIKVPLKSRNVFTLLISVLLSAQCTDVNVNNVTKNIYPKYHKPEHFVKLGRKKIETLIKKIGIFRIKAKSIYNLSRILVKDYNGKVPKTFEELEKLPGVETEKDLKRLFPRKYWNKLHLQIIYYGREYCKARDCYGLSCKICTSCYPNRKKPFIAKKP